MNNNTEFRNNPYLTILPYMDEKKVWSKRESQWFRERITFLRALYENDQFYYEDQRHQNEIDICNAFLEELGARDFHIPTGHGMYKNILPIIRGLHPI